jgi:hypothetical protein
MFVFFSPTLIFNSLTLGHKSSKNHSSSFNTTLEYFDILEAMIKDLKKLENLLKWILLFYFNLIQMHNFHDNPMCLQLHAF